MKPATKKILFIIMLAILIIGGYYIFTELPSENQNDKNLSGNDDTIYVYEEEVDSAEECTEFEKYDAKRGVCFFECTSEKECAEINKKIDDIFGELEGEYKEFSKDFKEFKGDSQVLEDNAEVVYTIEPGEKFVISSGSENDQHIKIKKWLATISPDDFSDKYIYRLIPYTKSEDNSVAYVTRSDVPGKWDMYVSMETFQDGEKEMIFTLIHEFAHILTLNNAQLDDTINESSCNQRFVIEGCLNADSYLNALYNKFWKDKFNPEVEDSLENYDKNPNAFVTEYAATNPEEDIAETFATFVFNKKKESPSTIAEEKIAFFYVYPKPMEIRTSIRLELKSFVRNRIKFDDLSDNDLKTKCCEECKTAFSKSPIGVGPEMAMCGNFGSGKAISANCKIFFENSPMSVIACENYLMD